MDRSAEVVVSLQISRVQEQVMSTGGSLDDLYDQHARSLYRYALALTSSPEDAEDAVQEVFVGLARQRNCDRLARISNIRAYLLKAARNAAFTILRSRQRRGELEQALAEDEPTAPFEDGSGPVFDSLVLGEAFARLPIEQREALLLKVVDGLTFREIAKTVGVSINTAASRYRYAIEKLRESLENEL